ncbi:hypothetical protein [Alkalicoccus saliphilus]|jgi:hypothetical protein|uniref:hypothetical protein n=1 Tax=Alkalicoccus saliphilus TaxID=200989 RepID=UPI00135AC42F|nr:hypothetical protein [Alkalicoccus saliphilus]
MLKSEEGNHRPSSLPFKIAGWLRSCPFRLPCGGNPFLVVPPAEEKAGYKKQ